MISDDEAKKAWKEIHKILAKGDTAEVKSRKNEIIVIQNSKKILYRASAENSGVSAKTSA
ncbi:MAG: hypothetical protein LBM98_08125 [Oscillospiraceae bacterium]|jgi:hypothetical protein|nr:hypothetical protein [Oscillospiraceae bacterium]